MAVGAGVAVVAVGTVAGAPARAGRSRPARAPRPVLAPPRPRPASGPGGGYDDGEALQVGAGSARAWHGSAHDDSGARRHSPIENIASRSCWENASKATSVCVRATPGSCRSCPVITSRELLVARDAHDRDEVPLARHGVRLGDPLEVGQRAAERRHRVPLGLDEDDRVRHGVCDSPGASTMTCAKPACSTSALNACASVSIGGNVS